MRPMLLTGALIGAMALAGGASAAVRIGTLSCHEHGGWGYVLGGSNRVACDYKGANGRYERYHGRISKLGVDLGYQHSGEIVWAVFAPSADTRHALDGHYGGVTADAAVGAGVGANALVGGFGRSFVLQPLSIEGLTGVKVAAGVGALSLHSGA